VSADEPGLTRMTTPTLTLLSLVSSCGNDHSPRPMGSLFRCLCPLHAERTPSFTIYPDDSFFCFGCARGGNAAKFVQLKEKLATYAEACRWLEENGFKLSPLAPVERRPPELTGEQKAAIRVAGALYREQFRPSRRAREYLCSRNIDPDWAGTNGFGYCFGNGLMDELRRANLDFEAAMTVGLLDLRDGVYKEKMRGRVIITHPAVGTVEWLTGRTTYPAKDFKYLNTCGPKPAFWWRQEYAGKRVVLLEGPLDAVVVNMLGQPGVGALGAYVTHHQISQMENASGFDILPDAGTKGHDIAEDMRKVLLLHKREGEQSPQWTEQAIVVRNLPTAVGDPAELVQLPNSGRLLQLAIHDPAVRRDMPLGKRVVLTVMVCPACKSITTGWGQGSGSLPCCGAKRPDWSGVDLEAIRLQCVVDRTFDISFPRASESAEPASQTAAARCN